MSVLIKGMKMPTSCLKGGCPLDGFACQLWEDKYWSRVESPEKKRHKNCPLIELPDHGDLIEKRQIVDALANAEKNVSAIQRAAETEKDIRYCQGVMVGYANSILVIDNAPVIIPAERSEDGET